MARLRAADKAMDKLRKWARRDEWKEHFDQTFALHFGVTCEALEIEVKDLVAALDDHSRAMLEGSALEDFATFELDDGRNVIDDYLARRGRNVAAPVRRWLRALRSSRVSLWEVVALDPGRTMTLKDLLAGGEPVVVDERAGSKSAVLWDRLMVRVVPLGDTYHLTGAVLVFRPAAAEAVIGRFEAAFKALRREVRRVTRAAGETVQDDEAIRQLALLDVAPILTQEWLIEAYEAVTAPPPEFVNADGEALLFGEVRLPLKGESNAVAQRLDRVAALDRDGGGGDPFWNWLAPQEGTAARAPEAQGKFAILSSDAMGRSLLGSVRIEEGDAVVLDVNSRERAERGRVLLAEVLGPLAGEPETVLRTLDEIKADGGGAAAPEPDLTPEEQAEIIADYLDEHFTRMLDGALAMLDGKTPREAARTKKGRAAVATWLKLLENHERRRVAGTNEPAYDFDWMWDVLGVAELRR